MLWHQFANECNARTQLTGDVFIAPHQIGSSMHGDRVLVEVSSVRSDGRAEGRILRTVDRAHATVVGTFHYGRRHNYVTPMDEKITQEIIIAEGNEYPQNAPGEEKRDARFAASGVNCISCHVQHAYSGTRWNEFLSEEALKRRNDAVAAQIERLKEK